MEYTTLNNGVKMPMVWFGVFQVNDQKQCQMAVENAIEAGYRSIDTAASYMNDITRSVLPSTRLRPTRSSYRKQPTNS